MRALLHDRGAFAVILAYYNESAAGNAAGGEIGDGVGRNVDADRRLESDGAADRVIYRRREHGGGGGFRGRVFEVNAELVEHILGVGKHVHQMRNRGALVTADVSHARLQQRLGNRKNSFAAEFVAVAELEILHFARKRAFSHKKPPGQTIDPTRPTDSDYLWEFPVALATAAHGRLRASSLAIAPQAKFERRRLELPNSPKIAQKAHGFSLSGLYFRLKVLAAGGYGPLKCTGSAERTALRVRRFKRGEFKCLTSRVVRRSRRAAASWHRCLHRSASRWRLRAIRSTSPTTSICRHSIRMARRHRSIRPSRRFIARSSLSISVKSRA